MDTKFGCTACGACCRTKETLNERLHAGLPLKPGTIECANLQPDNSCAIYETRPKLCRVDDVRPPGYSVIHWHAAVADWCQKLQDQERSA